ncbi:MAG: DNA repair protein RecN [Anaerolineales bacterium]|nr:DNA repair protein RecN [Anaerolineales bacterium]
MLTELRIRDFAIIDNLELDFPAGFVIFTGETGAGKSIIVDAVEALLGGRTGSEFVRAGCQSALVEGVFRVDTRTRAQIQEVLEREELQDDADFLTLGREIRDNGRTIARVNGRTTTVGLLQELGELLVDVHGQSEHLSLLRVREHQAMLDRFARNEASREEYHDAYQEWQQVHHELDALRQQEDQAASRLELLKYQISEIESARLKSNELDELLEERNRLANAEQLAELVSKATAALSGGYREGDSAVDRLGQAVEAVTGLSVIDPALKELSEETQGLADQVQEIARRLRSYREEIDSNPKRLEEVEERIALIRSLQRKYGGDIEAVLAHAENARSQLDSITHAEERILELEELQVLVLEKIGELGGQLSLSREQAGEEISAGIEGELKDLKMAGARFGVSLEWDEKPDGAPFRDRKAAFGPHGMDRIEFLIAPNPGEGLKPLAKIASGGETSRLMLGLKGVLAKADNTPSLIFDEIDQGIGGRVGAVVGEKLWRLTSDHQVFCITHLPQLAAFGDAHFRIEKQVVEDRTITTARLLCPEERREELASMLGSVTDTNLHSAAEMMEAAEKTKAAEGE